MSIGSNAEFLEILTRLIEGWCDRRSFRPLSRILAAYLSFNGMTDGWGELGVALKSIRALDRGQLTPVEQAIVDDLIGAVDGTLPKK